MPPRVFKIFVGNGLYQRLPPHRIEIQQLADCDIMFAGEPYRAAISNDVLQYRPESVLFPEIRQFLQQGWALVPDGKHFGNPPSCSRQENIRSRKAQPPYVPPETGIPIGTLGHAVQKGDRTAFEDETRRRFVILYFQYELTMSGLCFDHARGEWARI